MSDRIFGVVVLLLAGFYIWAATIIPDSFIMDVVGPRTFAIIIGVVGIICALVFIARPDQNPAWPSMKKFAELGAAVVVMSIYAGMLPVVGFLIATFFATAYLSWRLGSKPVGSLITGFFTSVGIYVVFRLILGLSLATSPFGF